VTVPFPVSLSLQGPCTWLKEPVENNLPPFVTAPTFCTSMNEPTNSGVFKDGASYKYKREKQIFIARAIQERPRIAE